MLVLFFGITSILSAATSRIKDFGTTATSAAGDDYIALDGTTNGTRKILAERFVTNATVSGASGKTLTFGNTLTLANTDGITLDIGSGVTLNALAGISISIAVENFLDDASSANLATAVTGETGSGALVFGTSPSFTTNLTLATSASPSTGAAGTIAFDTDAWGASRGAPQVYDGTANIILLGTLASDTPSNGQVPTWNTGGTITWENAGTGSGNVTNNATLTSGNITIGGGTTVIGTSNVSWNATNNTLTTPNLAVTTNATFGNLTTTNLTISGTISGVIPGANGGTGVANTGLTITLAGNLTTSGANNITLTSTGATNVTLPTTGTLSTLAGTETLSNKIVTVSGALGTDDTYSGMAVSGLNAGATIAQWEAVYVGGSSTYLLADANGSGTFPAVGLAVAAYVSTNAAIVVRNGTVRNDAWTWTPGGTVYLSTTAGGLTQTAPSTTGDKVQVIGTALTADILLVHVSADYGTAP